MDGSDFNLVTLCPSSTALFASLSGRGVILSICVKNLRALIAGEPLTPAVLIVEEEADGSESERND